ncbi:MAG: AraC family transcriptional regulator [Leptolyngbya sp. DLM2.Bin15]|nr:MAG: AraC family transcriptional regulator [Leptolyngbya sp. DLM2.Bin15]
MAIALSNAAWRELWDQSRQQASPADPDDGGDRLAICPSQLATGYKRDIALRNGIDLTLHRYKLWDDLEVTPAQAIEDTNCLEFMFNLSSRFKYWDGAFLQAGQHCLQGRFTPVGKETAVHCAQDPTLEVDIHLEPATLQSLLGIDGADSLARVTKQLPPDLQRLIAGDLDVSVSSIQAIPPAMQVALQQILDCPYHGLVKQLYLESKSVEVLALWLEQALSPNASKSSSSMLRSDDVDRVYHAREILQQHVDNPPTLIDLARQVGLNDCTLKRRFRQVFGTTVFGYLHHHRMEQAQTLLLENQLSVTAIAHRVGYSNLCAFSTAFRKKFGMSPREMRR